MHECRIFHKTKIKHSSRSMVVHDVFILNIKGVVKRTWEEREDRTVIRLQNYDGTWEKRKNKHLSLQVHWKHHEHDA